MITWFCFCPFTAGALFLRTVALLNTFFSSVIPDGTEEILHPCRWIGLLGLVCQPGERQEGTDSPLHKDWHGTGSPGGLSWVQSHFHFPLALCAHRELLLLSCHCCFIIITRLLSQSPVPNLALGNASSWEVSSVSCRAYLLRMQWKGTSR